jgi:hypothetical protein
MQIPADPNPSPKSIHALQEEDARLKSLVVTLSAFVLTFLVGACATSGLIGRHVR